MKRVYYYLLITAASICLSACDYFGWFDFTITNNTNDSLAVEYREQMQSFTSVLYTPGYDGDYHYIYLDSLVTKTVIPPHQSMTLNYDAGLVDSRFPTQLEDPKEYGIVPLWERIDSISVRGDTLDSDVYAQDKWVGKKSDYTLTIDR